ncbi:MAG: hypothetical protein HY589_05820, partial [Candidatus Omnitrophica bacterium]|nr:hypothetical protein [Candidatus Omnitrophota bacterium]
ENAWEEMHRGADINIPRVYKFIIKYITPLFLFFVLGFWFYQEGIPVILMKGALEADRPYILAARLGLIALFVTLCALVKIAWAKRSPSPTNKKQSGSGSFLNLKDQEK